MSAGRPWLCAVPHLCLCCVLGQPVVTPSAQVYNADGEFLFKFGSHGEGNGQFNAPTGVAVDANGNIIVADWGNSRIQVPAPQPRAALGGDRPYNPRDPSAPQCCTGPWRCWASTIPVPPLGVGLASSPGAGRGCWQGGGCRQGWGLCPKH